MPPSDHGGFRPGAGRPAGEPSQRLRVPESQVPAVLAYLDAYRKPAALGPPRPLSPDPSLVALSAFLSRVPAGLPGPADDTLDDAVDLNTHLVIAGHAAPGRRSAQPGTDRATAAAVVRARPLWMRIQVAPSTAGTWLSGTRRRWLGSPAGAAAGAGRRRKEAWRCLIRGTEIEIRTVRVSIPGALSCRGGVLSSARAVRAKGGLTRERRTSCSAACAPAPSSAA